MLLWNFKKQTEMSLDFLFYGCTVIYLKTNNLQLNNTL
jgi:hypothetical protein